MRPYGLGRLSGLTRVEGVNTPNIPVEIVHRGTGIVLERKISGSSGEFIFEGYNVNEIFDVIARPPGKSAVISDSRKPVYVGVTDPYAALVIQKSSCFDNQPMSEAGNSVFLGEIKESMRVAGFGPWPGTDSFGRANMYKEDRGMSYVLLNTAIGTSDFTIEGMVFIRRDGYTHNGSGTAYPRIFQLGRFGAGANSRGFALAQGALLDRNLILQQHEGSTWSDIVPGGTLGKIDGDRWVHVAVTRSGTVWRVFIDGEKRCEATYTGLQDFGILEQNSVLGIGCNGHPTNSSGEAMCGFFSSIRVTKACRYTANFAPPNKPFEMLSNRIYNTLDSNRTNANTRVSWDGLYGSAISWHQVFGVSYKKTGKWYFEVKKTSGGTAHIGVGLADRYFFITWSNKSNAYAYNGDGKKAFTGDPNWAIGETYAATYGVGDAIGVAVDFDGGKLTFYKNGVSQGVAYTNLSGKELTPFAAMGNSDTWVTSEFNFGQKPFDYPVPEGYNPGWYDE